MSESMNTVENARIIAETHMMAQRVDRSPYVCMFEYDKNGQVWMDGVPYSVSDFLMLPGSIVGWFFDMVPTETMLVMNRIYEAQMLDESFDSDPSKFDFQFIVLMRRILWCKCDNMGIEIASSAIEA